MCSRLRKEVRLDLGGWCWGLGLGFWGRGWMKRSWQRQSLQGPACAGKLGLARIKGDSESSGGWEDPPMIRRKKKEKLVRRELSSFNVLSLRSIWTPGGHQVDSGK